MEISYLNDEFFARLETLALNLRPDLSGYFGGKHLVKTYGQTVEFADFREYQLGDDIRRIDWNLFSRFEKYFLRLFTDERQMQVQIFLDCSASIGRPSQKKAAYSVAAAAALGFLAVHNMDKLSFRLMKGNTAVDPFGTIVGKNAFFRAVNTLKELEFEDDADISACISDCPDTGEGNGLTVIVSDFFTESDWKKAVDYLCYKRRQVLLLQTLTPEELDPAYDGRFNLIDVEAAGPEDERNMRLRITRSHLKAYEQALHDFFGDISDFCTKRGVGYLRLSTEEPLEKALFGELLKEGIMS